MTRPLTVADWLQAYREGADPRVLLSDCLRRAREEGPDAVWIYLAGDDALARQLARLAVLADGLSDREALLQRLPLYGVPYAVKDNIDIAAVPTTAACPELVSVPRVSAGVVSRLEAAGAIWIGKTNLDQFATGLVGTRSPYGQPASVFSATHVSGGSSSGSAVAVAAGLVAFALGTDTAGSGRIPAAFNQIVGMKPTRGRVGTSGVLPACRSLDCVSVFALTVDDAAHVLATIEGPDPADAYSAWHPGPAAWADHGLRIGVPHEPRLAADGAYAAGWQRALELARSLGQTTRPVDFTPLHRTGDLLYEGPWVAERYSAVRPWLEAAPEAIDPVVKQVIGAAERYSATDAFEAQYSLRALQRAAEAVWDEVDVLMVPTAPGHPGFAEVAADPVGTNSALGLYTNFVNLLGWCALALPAAREPGRLPFGITFIAPAGHDAALARLGAAWQAHAGLELGATAARHGPPPHGLRLRTPQARRGLPIAVVGAHLSGMPLNAQLTERGARLIEATRTGANYRLYALPGTVPFSALRGAC
jgi:allophanate hydrolase